MSDYLEAIKDPLIELLAIKLFEHDIDSVGQIPISPRLGWMTLPSEDRESYRELARGDRPIGVEPDELDCKRRWPHG